MAEHVQRIRVRLKREAFVHERGCLSYVGARCRVIGGLERAGWRLVLTQPNPRSCSGWDLTYTLERAAHA